ncbi:hypothetical protein GQ53DRAFT_514232 [Thozetella sp. PMI_491]|nr:hypothetical protein GQ53DRAFT_514232 [Thozetella sp. PMI_491]
MSARSYVISTTRLPICQWPLMRRRVTVIAIAVSTLGLLDRLRFEFQCASESNTREGVLGRRGLGAEEGREPEQGLVFHARPSQGVIDPKRSRTSRESDEHRSCLLSMHALA